jgi:hypothetical protein
MPSPALLAIALVLFVLLLAPAGRLQRAGWPPRALGAYLIVMLGLGLLVAYLPGPTRFLVPIIVVGFLAPFVAVPAGIERWRRPRRSVVVEPAQVKTVHGPARDVAPTVPPHEAPADGGSDSGQGGSTPPR